MKVETREQYAARYKRRGAKRRKIRESDIAFHDAVPVAVPIGHGSKPNHKARVFNRFATDMVRIKVDGAHREVPYEPKYISDDFGNRMHNPNWSGDSK